MKKPRGRIVGFMARRNSANAVDAQHMRDK